jgi:hypothetical protein
VPSKIQGIRRAIGSNLNIQLLSPRISFRSTIDARVKQRSLHGKMELAIRLERDRRETVFLAKAIPGEPGTIVEY